MKICFVAPRYHTNQHGWVQALTTLNHEVHYVVAYDSKHSPANPATLHVISRVPVPHLLRITLDTIARLRGQQPRGAFHSWPNYQELKKTITEIGPEVIVVRDIFQFISLQTFWLSKSVQTKVILYDQHPLRKKLSLGIRLLQLLRFLPTRRITPVTQDKNQVQIGNSWYVPLTIHTENTIPKQDYAVEDKIRLLCIAKFTLKRKNHLLLLKALQALPKNVYLTLIGTHTEKKSELTSITEYIEHQSLNERVEILSNVPHEKIGDYYKQADIFVLPSIREPFSISTLEAMAYGLPVIISTDNGSRHCVLDHTNGLIIKPDDQADLTKKLQYLVNHPNLIENYGRSACKHVLGEYGEKSARYYWSKLLTSLKNV